MPRRQHICDVDGCTRERQRWQRLCGSCFGRLATRLDLRTGILEAHKTGNRAEKRRLCRRAGEALGLLPAGATPAAQTRPAPARPSWWQDF